MDQEKNDLLAWAVREYPVTFEGRKGQVVAGFIAGESYREMATRMGVTVLTIRKYMKNSLGIAKRYWAIRNNLGG
jgi:hypothetical protein